MPYTYTTFDGVTLPIYNTEQDHSPGSVESALIDTPNGAYDYLGATRRLPRRQEITASGILFDESNLLVTEDGDFIVDESGNYLVQGDTGDTLRAQIDALKNKLGRAGQLVRVDSESGTSRQKLCRLLRVAHPRRYDDRLIFAPVSAMFETAQVNWKSTAATTTTDSLTAGINVVTVDVLGTEDVPDAIITVTAGASALTSIQIILGNADFTWTGTLASGNDLVIDTGALTIENNGGDAYDGLVLNAGHLLPGWLLLLPESNEVEVTVSHDCDIEVVHYDQWM
jgi:hypothetical protein